MKRVSVNRQTRRAKHQRKKARDKYKKITDRYSVLYEKRMYGLSSSQYSRAFLLDEMLIELFSLNTKVLQVVLFDLKVMYIKLWSGELHKKLYSAIETHILEKELL